MAKLRTLKQAKVDRPGRDGSKLPEDSGRKAPNADDERSRRMNLEAEPVVDLSTV